MVEIYYLKTTWYVKTKNVKIKYWQRPKKIKDFVDNPYFEKVLTESNFIKQKTNDNLKVGDVLLFEGEKNSLSHVAVYIGDMMILNHSIRALSCRELFGLKYQQTLREVYRYAA